MNSKILAKIIHEHRKQSGLSQQELAKLAGVGKTVVFDVEKGKDTVKLKTLLKILEVLNIKLKLEGPFVRMEEK
jgi:y4mF family transcriptional regulator